MPGGGSLLAAPSWSQGTHPPTPSSPTAGVSQTGAEDVILGYGNETVWFSIRLWGGGRGCGCWKCPRAQVMRVQVMRVLVLVLRGQGVSWGAGVEGAWVQAWVRWV